MEKQYLITVLVKENFSSTCLGCDFEACDICPDHDCEGDNSILEITGITEFKPKGL